MRGCLSQRLLLLLHLQLTCLAAGAAACLASLRLASSSCRDTQRLPALQPFCCGHLAHSPACSAARPPIQVYRRWRQAGGL